MTLIEAARLYAGLGWGVVPLSAGKKVPMLKGWPSRPYTDPDALEDYYRLNPTHNLGIVAGFSRLVCVDCDGPEGREAFDRLVDANGGECGDPLVANTPSGGCHNVYRHPGNGLYIKSRAKRHNMPIDIKADGGQFAVQPSTGRGGLPYVWQSDLEREPGALPDWLLAWIMADDTPEEKAARKGQIAEIIEKANRLPRGGGYSGDKLQELLSRLENVKPRGANAWLACCPAHASIGRQSLSITIGDSQPIVLHCFAGCEPEDVMASVGMTVFDLLQERVEVVDAGVDLSGILNDKSQEPPPPSVSPPQSPPAGEFPMECVEGLPGILGEVVRYDLATAMYPQPVLALLGALALMSVITGRKVCDENDMRTNLYLVGLAPSGSGKNHSRMVLKRILEAAGPDAVKMLGNDRIGSHAGIIARLTESPATVMPVDEIGDLFASMKEGGAKSGQTKSIEPLLKQLYTSANDRHFTGDCYADLSRTKYLNQPHLGIFGSCPAGNYWDSMTVGNIEYGLIARFLVLEAAGHVRPVRHVRAAQPPKTVVDAVRAWVKWQPGDGNLEDANPTPAIVGFDQAAKDMLWEHTFAIAVRREEEDPRTAAVWSRCAEKTIKLALIMACSRVADPSRQDIVVGCEDVAWAKRLSLWCTRRMVHNVGHNVSENVEEAKKKRLLAIIAKSGESGVTQNDLTRKTQWLSRQERQRCLADMVESGEVSVTGKRPVHYVKNWP